MDTNTNTITTESVIKKSVGLVQAQIEDNCIIHGIRGILKHEDIEKMVANYTEEDKQARVYGKFQHLTGLVFKQFNRRIHIIKPFHINKNDFAVYERLDTHPRNPDACIWLAVDRNGTRYVVDEMYQEADIDELTARIKEKASNYRIINRKIEPAAYIEDQHTGRSLANDLAKMGLRYLPASKDRTHAIEMINQALSYREMNGKVVMQPELYIFDTCHRMIWELEHWQYQEYSGKTAEFKSRSEKPMDKDDHCIECLGRTLIDNPVFIEKVLISNIASEIKERDFDPYD